MLRLALAATAALTVLLAPAHAADIKQIDCVEKTVDKPTVKLLDDDVNKNFTDLDNQAYSQGTIAGFRAAAATCRAKYGWSDNASEAAVLYALYALSNANVRGKAKAAKLDYAKLAARFDKLSESERANAMEDATLNKLANGALDANEMDASNAKVAGAVFGFLAVRAKAMVDFAAN
ncbi:MAG: hypothetical protein KF730_06945 [Sphingomonas sp.]|uniref:hypothetical protein n=1 Tax=Sphingomonas sp. TaxID=28214 RepID=UPI0025FD9D08|nr:hypothetical protein [Sphingomonas sp.]MBX3564297.1 hypothetical protein [Sphingomonas sp.]